MSLALVYEQTGRPAEVLQLRDVEDRAPERGEVRLRVRAASINPSDLGIIGGTYGRLRELPAIAGREGMGEITAVGEGVEGWSIGDRALLPDGPGAWREAWTGSAEGLLRIPPDLPIEQAATSLINPPTALRLLRDFVELRAGDWIVQNAANSAVGLAVIQLCTKQGIHTLNMVRRASLVEPLLEAGADRVVVEAEDDWTKQLADLTGGVPPRLALNSVGGESVARQIKALAPAGVSVTFGGMVGDKVRFPTRFLIFNDVRLVGFWMDRWKREASQQAIQALFDEVFALQGEGVLHTRIEATYPLREWKRALEHQSGPRLGKILLCMDD